MEVDRVADDHFQKCPYHPVVGLFPPCRSGRGSIRLPKKTGLSFNGRGERQQVTSPPRER